MTGVIRECLLSSGQDDDKDARFVEDEITVGVPAGVAVDSLSSFELILKVTTGSPSVPSLCCTVDYLQSDDEVEDLSQERLSRPSTPVGDV